MTELSRRDAIKKSAAAGAAAGLVWSAPRIEGLSLRPNYAAAASAPLTWTARFNAEFGGDVRGVLIQGLDASPAVDGGEAAFGGPDGELLAVLGGTGLDAATLTIDAATSPGGPLMLSMGTTAGTANFLSRRIPLDPAPGYPLDVQGTFTCV